MKNMTIWVDIRKMNNDYKKNYSLLNQDLHFVVDAVGISGKEENC